MQAGYDDSTLIVEPHGNPAALRVDGGVIGARNPVAITAAGHDHKRLERASVQELTNIAYHAVTLVEDRHLGKST